MEENKTFQQWQTSEEAVVEQEITLKVAFTKDVSIEEATKIVSDYLIYTAKGVVARDDGKRFTHIQAVSTYVDIKDIAEERYEEDLTQSFTK